jgi:hypothetical protein
MVVPDLLVVGAFVAGIAVGFIIVGVVLWIITEDIKC